MFVFVARHTNKQCNLIFLWHYFEYFCSHQCYHYHANAEAKYYIKNSNAVLNPTPAIIDARYIWQELFNMSLGSPYHSRFNHFLVLLDVNI